MNIEQIKEVLSGRYIGKEVTVVLRKTAKPYTKEINFKGKLVGDNFQYYVGRNGKDSSYTSVTFNAESVNLITGDGTGNNIVITLK